MGAVGIGEGSGVLQSLLCSMSVCTSVLALGSQGTFAGGMRPPASTEECPVSAASTLIQVFHARPCLGCLHKRPGFCSPCCQKYPSCLQRRVREESCGLVGGQAVEQAGQQLCWQGECGGVNLWKPMGFPGVVWCKLRLVHHPRGPCVRTVVRVQQVSRGHLSTQEMMDRMPQCFKLMGILLFCCAQDGDVLDLPA